MSGMIDYKKPIFNLDDEEQALSGSFDRREWQNVGNLKYEIALYKQAAKNYFQEKEKVTIRVQTVDMEIIIKIAAERGLKPHTYIASIMHQVAFGQIKE